MNQPNTINYIEIPTRNIELTKVFFSSVFGWSFIDYGPEYCAFSGAGIDGGFFQSDRRALTATGSVLLVLYSDNIEVTQATIEQAGATITEPVFAFPGGCRFHFVDPSGNEFAVWSE